MPPRWFRSSWSERDMSAPGGVEQDTRESVPVRYRARAEYDGTEFAGFQVQPGARTVQGVLEAALAHLSGGIRQPVDGAGRTDAGVHAEGQVIAFTYSGRLSAAGLAEALNGLLPPDVAIRDLRRAARGFHPRYAARFREYRYTVWNGPRSPLRERTALRVRARPERCSRSGPAGGPPGHDRCPGRRLPARDGPAHGRRPPRGRQREDGNNCGRGGTRRSSTGLRRGWRPGPRAGALAR